LLNEQQQITGTLTLSWQERKQLLHIFLTRLKLWSIALLTMTYMMVYINLRSELFEDKDFGWSNNTLLIIRFGFLALLVYGSCFVLFWRRIYPYYKDYRKNEKEVVNYTITLKRFFPYTNQCFIGLDHPDYLFHQIEGPEWLSLNVGDHYPLYRAPKSKYVFNPKGCFTLM